MDFGCFIIVGNILETDSASREHMNVPFRDTFLSLLGASWNLCQYLDNIWMCHIGNVLFPIFLGNIS